MFRNRLVQNKQLQLVMTLIGLGALYVLVLVTLFHWTYSDSMLSYSLWMLTVMLIPTIRRGFREGTSLPLTSTIGTTVLLANVTIAIGMLGQWLSVLAVLTEVAAWTILMLQSIMYGEGA